MEFEKLIPTSDSRRRVAFQAGQPQGPYYEVILPFDYKKTASNPQEIVVPTFLQPNCIGIVHPPG